MKVLLTVPKFHAEMHICSKRLAEMHPHLKDEGPRNIGNNMSLVLDTRKSNFGGQ